MSYCDQLWKFKVTHPLIRRLLLRLLLLLLTIIVIISHYIVGTV